MFGANDRKLVSATRGIPIILMEPLEARLLLSATSASLSFTTTAVPDASPAASPSQLSPAMIQTAYDLANIYFNVNGTSTKATGAGQTIAIVDAYADPNIAADLETFDANFGITNDDAAGNFVLTIDTPQGTPQENAGWAAEESLDVEWAHAIAPEADIVLVEASSDSVSTLASAVVSAADLPGVAAVSISWGDSPEFAGETAYDADFTTPSGHQGVTFVAASGDNAQPNYPSTSSNVLAVGGTTLVVNNAGDYLSETAWADSGGGFSPYENTTKPDVAYDANPNTGVLVYDSVTYQGITGWQVVGGTSEGAPQWAAIITLADQGLALRGLTSLNGPTQTIPDLYSFPTSDFHDIGSGNTGLGSPVGEAIISDLVGGGVTSVGPSSGGSGTTTSPTQLAFAQQPTFTYAGDTLSPVIVDIENSNGSINTTADTYVTLRIASGPSGTILAGTVRVQAIDGVATFSNLTLDSAGTYTLEATDGSLTPADSVPFFISAVVVVRQIRPYLFNGVPLSPIALATQTQNVMQSEGTAVGGSDVSASIANARFAAAQPISSVFQIDDPFANSSPPAQFQYNSNAALLTSDQPTNLLADGQT
jgi:hypothetical protein